MFDRFILSVSTFILRVFGALGGVVQRHEELNKSVMPRNKHTGYPEYRER